jgi:hypothetical protein
VSDGLRFVNPLCALRADLRAATPKAPRLGNGKAQTERQKMLSADEIANAKRRVQYSSRAEVLHEHDDCIRIAYEWLDAQTITKGFTRKTRPIKHVIERWGGRYVSQSDVEVAAELHPQIEGKYPHFNISSRLTLPSDTRLTNIGEAKTHDKTLTDRDIKETYAQRE